jgi:hypothetical protein
LELDGAFKYEGEGIEIKGESLVIILSEYLNQNNNHLKKYMEKYEAKMCNQKIKKYKNNIDSSNYKNYNTINKNNVDNPLEKLQEIAENEIITDKRIVIDKNDIILIENKREYPHHLSNEIRNFIEHSFYFISLYKNLEILKTNAKIHLLFVYDHYRNCKDEGQVVVELYKIIKENSEKLKIFPNKIKLYLVHSLPNLNISIFNKLETEIKELNNQIKEMKEQIATNNRLSNKINDLEKEIEALKSPKHKKNDNINKLCEKEKNKESRNVDDNINNKFEQSKEDGPKSNKNYEKKANTEFN